MFHVSISIANESLLTSRMEAMRMWLDGRRFEPTTFRYDSGDQTIVCRVDFTVEVEAAELAKAFDGNVVGGSALAI